MNNHIEISLRTWYPKDHPLHFDPIHPAMGLVGEVGEWINKHKKNRFKPDFNFVREDELDELGDIWYYLRILSYQFNVEKFITFYEPPLELTKNTLTHAMTSFSACSGKILSQAFSQYKSNTIIKYDIMNIYENLDLHLEFGLEVSLNELTALNWEKLKPGSTRGDEWTGSWDKMS